jgi:hypothetical protein
VPKKNNCRQGDDYEEGEFDEDGGRNGIVAVLVLDKAEVEQLFALLEARQAKESS